MKSYSICRPLDYFTELNVSRFVRVVANGLPSFAWPNNIVICTHVCVSQLHSSIHRGTAGCLHILWIIMLQRSWEFRYCSEKLLSFPLDVFPEVRLLECMVVLVLIFEEPSYCFPEWLHQFTFQTLYRDPLFSANTYYLLSSYNIILVGRRW